MVIQTRREKLREATIEEIKRVALTQMAEGGAATLSIRAIATEMGMSAPSLYNYYKSRDELVTALIVDAYTSLGDATHAANSSFPEHSYGARFLAVSIAFREWAISNREKFILIYGSPIPGYHAPVEITTRASVRATAPFVEILEQAWQVGKLKIPPVYRDLKAINRQQIEKVFQSQDASIPPALVQIVMEGWGMIHGTVSLELYGHLDYLGGDMAELYRAETLAYLRRIELDLE